MTPDLILFLTLAFVAVATAVSMLLSKNAIYAAMFLVLNFITVAVLYLLLNAAFIAMVQITVYAGAIMVLFLFVIMLLGAEKLGRGTTLRWQPPVAIALGTLLLGELVYLLLGDRGALAAALGEVTQGFGSPASVGALLFERYLVPFEVTSILLLVAMVGAIVLTRDEREGRP
jgi:NADH-quinone oxidoreductase subunit J